MEKCQWVRLLCSVILCIIVLTLTACSSKEDEILTPPEPDPAYLEIIEDNYEVEDDIENYIFTLLQNEQYSTDIDVYMGDYAYVNVIIYVENEDEAISLFYVSDEIKAYLYQQYPDNFELISVDVEFKY